MNRLTLLLAWIAPLWFMHRISHKTPMFLRAHLSPFDFQWHVAFRNHHFSKSYSLRRALVAALRKVKPAQQENPPHA